MLKIKFKFINILLRLGSFLFGYQAPPIPSVSAIIEKGKKILVIKLTYKDGFALPGGILKGNEDFEAAIRREVKEETGLKLDKLKYFSTYCETEPYSKVNITYLAKAKGNIGSSREGVPMWTDPNKVIDKLVYEDNKTAIKEYLDK